MDQRLIEVAQRGDIDGLYSQIEEDPHGLEAFDKIPFVDTPLHVAAAAGHTQFALEMMRLKTSFARKPNPNGFCPVHLALQKGHETTVLGFVGADRELVCVKGREGRTPLHYVAETGDLHLLTKFLSVCPISINDLTIRSESAFHIAAKNNRHEALKVLLGWLQRIRHTDPRFRRPRILDVEDDEGNTVLHIATARSQNQVVRLLVNTFKVEVNSKNKDGFTTLDMLGGLQNEEVKHMLCRAGARTSSDVATVAPADYLKTNLSFYDNASFSIIYGKLSLSAENRNALLVVVALIVTATYQAGLTPPESTEGDADAVLVEYFTILNDVAFSLSCCLMILHLPEHPFLLFTAFLLGLLISSHMLSVQITTGKSLTSLLMINFCIFIIFVLTRFANGRIRKQQKHFTASSQ